MFDFNGFEDLQKSFANSINNKDIQHVKGYITRIDGNVIELNETNLLDEIRYDSQCTDDSDVFGFGQMYIGSAEVKLNISADFSGIIKGGELRLNFWTEKFPLRSARRVGHRLCGA